MNKQVDIRKTIKLKRDNLPINFVIDNSKIIYEKLINLENFNKFENYFVYNDFRNEVETGEIISYLKGLNKTISHPLIIGDEMFSVIPTSNDFILDNFKIKTPKDYDITSKIEVAIIPLIACDKNKNRIGFGKGFYDKFLKDKNILKIGLCYDFQVVENIQPKQSDIPLDIIITEKQIIK